MTSLRGKMRSRRLIGLPVIDEHRGTILGRVIDIIISPRLQVEGLVIEAGAESVSCYWIT